MNAYTCWAGVELLVFDLPTYPIQPRNQAQCSSILLISLTLVILSAMDAKRLSE